MARKSLKPNELSSVAFSEFMEQFVEESDRAAVILGAAKIDLLLCALLDRYLLPVPGSIDDLLEGDAPIGTFSSRIKLCHRLGLIDDQFAKLLNIFRKLRNAYAHEVADGSLSSGSARDRIASLAEPFAHFAYFRSLVGFVSKRTKRSSSDAGVVFRALLAVFHIHLERLREEIEPVALTDTTNIVTRCAESKISTEEDHEIAP